MNDQNLTFKDWLRNRYHNLNTVNQYELVGIRFCKSGYDLTQEGVEKFFSHYTNHIVNRAGMKALLKFRNVTGVVIPEQRSHNKKVKDHQDFLELEDINRLIAVLPEKEQIMVRLYFETGLRLNELLNLQKIDINPATRFVKGVGKGSKPFKLKFSPKMAAVLERYLEVFTRYDYPFQYKHRNGSYYQRSDAKFWKILKDKGDEIGIENMHPHRIRHSLGHYLRTRIHLDLEQIREKLRHSQLETTRIYVTASMEEVDALLEEKMFK